MLCAQTRARDIFSFSKTTYYNEKLFFPSTVSLGTFFSAFAQQKKALFR